MSSPAYTPPVDQPTVKEAIHSLINGSQSVPSTAPPNVPLAKRFFALLVGVDKYANSQCNLSGAVRDAERMKEYIVTRMAGSDVYIDLLRDDGATAKKIVASLESLCTNSLIQRDDPILICYAGHGSSLPVPPGWVTGNSRIQCLSPHDARVSLGGVVVENVIPDRVFGALLERLAAAKGDNITVILDCCHSGSGSRDPLSDVVPRGMEFRAGDDTTELTLDESYEFRELWKSDARGIAKLPEFANTGLQSHIILAACGSDESAYEDRHKHEGRFTSALLRILGSSGTEALTYSQLIHRLDKRVDNLLLQTPRCEGRDKETRFLFDSGEKGRRVTGYDMVRGAGSSFVVPAGQILGVHPGDVFSVYKDRAAFASGHEPIGTVTVDSTGPLSSRVSAANEPAFDSVASFIPGAVAYLSITGRHSDFRLHVGVREEEHPELYKLVLEVLAQEALEAEHYTGNGLALFPERSASLSIVPGANDTVDFLILDNDIRDILKLTRLNGSVPRDQDSLRYALRSAAHFFCHLRSFPTSGTEERGLHKAVDVGICELRMGVGFNAEGIPVRVMEPIHDSVTFGTRGEFKPRLDDTFYGVNLSNKSLAGRQGFDLSAWVFYFDCSTLEIIKYYQPPTLPKDKSDPPLPAGMKRPLPLNYGDAGGEPLSFVLPPGQTVDGGFLRIFLSTREVDLSGIAQGPAVGHDTAKGTAKVHEVMPLVEMWGAITIPIVIE